jgi:hypothetical protein
VEHAVAALDAAHVVHHSLGWDGVVAHIRHAVRHIVGRFAG